MSNGIVKVRVRLCDVMKLKEGESISVVTDRQVREGASLPQTTVEAEIPIDEITVVGSMIRITKPASQPQERRPRNHLRIVGKANK